MEPNCRADASSVLILLTLTISTRFSDSTSFFHQNMVTIPTSHCLGFVNIFLSEGLAMVQDRSAKTGTIQITLPEELSGYEQFSMVSEQLFPEHKSTEIQIENKVIDPFVGIDDN